jgi:hypothetical protein
VKRVATTTALLGATGLTACGATAERANVDRPPATIMMTAAIHAQRVQVSPATAGAGPITLVVSNQTTKPQRVTFETDEIGGSRVGRRAQTQVIAPQGTGQLKINARSGRYAVHTQDRGIRAAHIRIGAERHSAQDDLLRP